MALIILFVSNISCQLLGLFRAYAQGCAMPHIKSQKYYTIYPILQYIILVFCIIEELFQ
jgi:hydrogenase/urease accessory protein HupE